jgi:hypothetical protein
MPGKARVFMADFSRRWQRPLPRNVLAAEELVRIFYPEAIMARGVLGRTVLRHPGGPRINSRSWAGSGRGAWLAAARTLAKHAVLIMRS